MPNFPLPIGRGANSNVADRLKADTVPKFPFAPDMTWSCTLTAKQLALRTQSQVITVLINSTADGDHILSFSGGGLAEPVDITFAASGNTAAQIAAGLEAAIQTARATTLAGVVTNETVSTATITITCLTKARNVDPVTITNTQPDGDTDDPTFTYTYGASLNPTSTSTDGVNGHTNFMPEFPTNVVRGQCTVNRRVAFAGTTALTIIVGDAGATNGLVTATSIMSTGVFDTIAAAENTPRFESAFVPAIAFSAASATPLSFQGLTAGEVEITIEYFPVVIP